MIKRRPSTANIIIGCVIALLLIIIGVLIWKYQSATKDPEAENKAKVAEVTTAVGKIYQLPADEEPTVALIEDKSKLGTEAFYKSAENGDYVLVYSKSQLAILYRPTDNKIINVQPVSLANNDGKPAVAVLNGSGNAERLSSSVNKIKELADQASVATTTDAKKTIDKTVVVDVTGQNPALAKTIADKLGAKVETSVPNDETIPNGATIVVVVGKS